ncbi:MAG: hypothetical protein ACPG51_04720, partial [Thiolinea sp.]
TAKALNSTHPISKIVVGDKYAYVLQFIGRQEAVQQSFAEVKNKIIQELEEEYRTEQRKFLLSDLRKHFQDNVEIHPDFQ